MDRADVQPQYNFVSNKDLTLHESYSDFCRRLLVKRGGHILKKKRHYHIKKSRSRSHK